ncbi:hypothetical protein BH11ARM2_BH11ARM2_24730 [soil metagenome]
MPCPRFSPDGLPVTDWENTTVPKLGGKPLPPGPYESSRSLAVLPDASGFLLGCDWSLRLFGKDGEERWHVPVPGVAWAVNASGDGKLAVAALGDGTVRWYRISDGQELLALYAHPDKKRWVLWTPGGYYDCSPGGEDLIGWSVNNGADHEADFYPASRFRSTYYRPDVIAKVLGTLDEGKALAEAGSSAAPPVAQILPPVVENVKGAREGSKLTLSFDLRSQTAEPVTRLDFYVNGTLVKTEDGLGLDAMKPLGHKIYLDVGMGAATVAVQAWNRFSPSVLARLDLPATPPSRCRCGRLKRLPSEPDGSGGLCLEQRGLHPRPSGGAPQGGQRRRGRQRFDLGRSIVFDEGGSSPCGKEPSSATHDPAPRSPFGLHPCAARALGSLPEATPKPKENARRYDHRRHHDFGVTLGTEGATQSHALHGISKVENDQPALKGGHRN